MREVRVKHDAADLFRRYKAARGEEVLDLNVIPPNRKRRKECYTWEDRELLEERPDPPEDDI